MQLLASGVVPGQNTNHDWICPKERSGGPRSMNQHPRISIAGFRRLVDVRELEVRPLTVVIGANGVGKSSLLDAFSLLAASAKGKLKEKMSAMGGLGSVLTRGVAENLSLELGMPVPGYADLRYELQLGLTGQAYEISKEVLSQQTTPNKPEPLNYIESSSGHVRYHDPETKARITPNWDHDHSESSLFQVPKMYQQCERFRRQLASLEHYTALGFDASAKSPVRLPQKMAPAILPGAAGEELVSCLFYMRETDRDRFDVVQDSLKSAFPQLERLDFPPVAAGTLAVAWKDHDFPKPIYADELSEGTLRFLWLATLLHSPGLTELTLIDEPEVSLHPELLCLMVDLLREAADRSRLIVATHSERLVRFLKPNEVLVCDAEDGRTRMRWADTMDLDRWLDDYALDEVWRLGRMGGRA